MFYMFNRFLSGVFSTLVWMRKFLAGATGAITAGFAMLALTTSAANGDTVLRVDRLNGSETGDGSGWGSSAFKFLQDALLDAPNHAPPVQIWVRGGATVPPYKPNEFAQGTPPCIFGDPPRCYSFRLRNSVALYGGFAGNEPETQAGFDSRKPWQNITTLSGDINGDDIFAQTPFDPQYIDDNSYHVVTGFEVQSSAVLDGFVIRHGNATDAPAR